MLLGFFQNMQQTFEHVVDAGNAGVVHGDGHGVLSMQAVG
jgi:hypothetical protein